MLRTVVAEEHGRFGEGDGFVEGSRGVHYFARHCVPSVKCFAEAERFAEGSLKQQFAGCQNLEDALGHGRVRGREKFASEEFRYGRREKARVQKNSV